jgi:hypothetical protein
MHLQMDTEPELNTQNDITEKRLALIISVILASLGYYIYMIWDKL